MFADREYGGLGREHPVVIGLERLADWREQRLQLHRLGGDDDFRRMQPVQFCEQGGVVLALRGLEAACGEVHDGKTEHFPAPRHGREVVVALGLEHPFVEMRAGGNDLCDLALHELAGPGVLDLVADGHLLPTAEQSRNVAAQGVMGDAAHWHHTALRQGNIEELGADLRVLEEHLIEIAEAEKQQRVLGQFALDAAILRHHGRELWFG